MNNNPSLSICIPSYNRGKHLPETLASVISQYSDELRGKVEICISDNASTDGTASVISQIALQSPWPIFFHRNEKNIGPDLNFINVVDIAHGQYCWLLGSDDILETGAVERILAILEQEKNLAGISVNHSAYSKDLRHRIYERGISLPTKLYDQCEEAFSDLGLYYGYLSGQIVSRELWRLIVERKPIKQYLNSYVHVYIIANMLCENPHWFYLSEALIGWRSENDSFLAELGRYRRLKIDIDGYESITSAVFGKSSPVYHHIMASLGKIHVRSHIMSARSNGVSSSFFLKSLGPCLKSFWRYPSFWIKTFPFFLIPSPVYRLLRWVYRRTWKRSTAFPLIDTQ